jgi:CHASE3 domain sensor protein
VKLPASFAYRDAAISLILALLAAAVLIGINETGYVQVDRALDRIDEYTRTRNAVSRLLQHVLDAETGSRGYLLTGDPRYLEPYNAAVAEIGQNLDNAARRLCAGRNRVATLAQLTATCSASWRKWTCRCACASRATRTPGSSC